MTARATGSSSGSRLWAAFLGSLGLAALARAGAAQPVPKWRSDLAIAADAGNPVATRLGALLRVLETQNVGLAAGVDIARLAEATSETVCPLTPIHTGDFTVAEALEPLAALTEDLYGTEGAPPIRLLARCARYALVDRLPMPEVSGVVIGRVQDSVGAPIATAEVVAVTAKRRALADSRGEFMVRWLNPGPELLLIRAIGYTPVRLPVAVELTDTLVISVPLQRGIQRLEDVVVTARGKRYEGRLAEFARRMEKSAIPGSRFIEREEIERWAPFDLGNVFRRAGLRVVADSIECENFQGGRPPGLAVYLDGSPFSEAPSFNVTTIPVHWIEAIEVYKGPAEIPIEYTRTGAYCAVLIWTRQP